MSKKNNDIVFAAVNESRISKQIVNIKGLLNSLTGLDIDLKRDMRKTLAVELLNLCMKFLFLIHFAFSI